jgi:TonB-dependent receptor
MRSFVITGLFVILATAAFAQSGKITGKVLNGLSGQPLPNATLLLNETSKTTVADPNGSFSFGKLANGTYSITCSHTGYKGKIIDSIVVANDDNTSISISLDEINQNLGEVIIKSPRARAAGETVASLLIAQKNSASVSDGITAETIRKTPDKTTGDVIKRVSGASIQDDRFAIIRGLNDRYNASFINGAPLPSTESDRKAFAFDIFPSSILDNLVIYKTATPDKSGEFAGGIIDITTKSILPKSFTSISFSGGFNSLITGKDRFYSENKGKKDWIGLDDGTRGMPSGIPSSAQIKNVLSFAQKAELAKLFGDYKWGIKEGNTQPNFNFQLSKGFNIEKNQQEFIGAMFAINYNHTYYFNTGQRNSYETDLISPGYHEPVQRGKYTDSLYNDEVIVAALANFSIRINNRNNLSWKNNFSINTDNKLLKRFGFPDYASDSLAYIKETVRWYTSNQILSSQLAGEHLIGLKNTKLNWLASYSRVKRDFPNLSRTTYTGSLPDFENVSAIFSTPPSQITGSGTMFFSTSNESIKSIKADIHQPYTFLKNSQNFVRMGGGYQYRQRDFVSRTLGLSPYNDPSNNVSFDNSLLTLREDQIFLPDHLGLMKNGKGGFLLNDGTLSNSDYDASSSLTHAYVMNDQRFFTNLRFIYGVRLETFNQKLNSIRNLHDTIALNTTKTDLLPSANLVYALTPKMNIRLSYALTLNRPEFRELAPFLFFDNVTSYLYEGTETLKRAQIANYDFRYEFFPGKAQLFSVSAFYKHFENPIEIVTLPNTTAQAKYINTTTAYVYGAEAEFRVLLSTLTGTKNENSFFNKLTLSANAAYLKSNVSLKDSLFGYSPAQLFSDRALQGQSPYIFNASIGYNDDKSGFSSTLSVNRVGDRILIAGTYNTPNIYEKARTVMDFQLAKFFLNKAIEVKFTAKDILAQNLSFYFDMDKTKSFGEKDRYFSSYKAPKVFNVSASLKF